MTDGEDQERLVLRAQAGDAQAFDELLRRHERELFRHILRLVHDEDRAYEVLQESYIVIVRNIRKLRVRECFRPWVFGIATRMSLKSISKRAGSREELSEPRQEPAHGEPLPEELVAAREELDAVQQRVLSLSAPLRSVMLLHFFEGLPLKDVAAALEVSLGTVKSRLAAGLAKVRAAEGGNR
jgi:RNA polymerase sigma-70 factor (ECF subfamily)